MGELPREEQIRRTASPERTICEALRELWDISEVLDETLKAEMQVRIVDAYTMAKKMDKRLREYKYDWCEDFWMVNEDYEEDLRRRSER